MENKPESPAQIRPPCWADREEAIRRIVVERDELFALLTRICRETVCLQAPSKATNNEPSKQRIYCFAADPDIHGKIQSLCLHEALGMLPVPTPLPPNAEDHGPPSDPSKINETNQEGGPVDHLVGPALEAK